VTVTTGSYAGWRPDHGAPARITLGLPRWRPPGREQWPYLAELAPRPWYFRAAQEKFDRMYRAQLDRLAGDIERKLGWLSEAYGPLALLCYERGVRSASASRCASWTGGDRCHASAAPRARSTAHSARTTTCEAGHPAASHDGSTARPPAGSPAGGSADRA